MEAIHQGEWNGMCSEEAEFMAELLGNCSLPNEVLSDTNFVVSPTFWPTHHESNRNNIGVVDEAAMYSSDDTNTTSMCSFSQGTSFSLFPFSSQESNYSTLSHHLSLTNNSLMTMDYSTMEVEEEAKNGFQLHPTNNNVMGLMGGDDFLNRDVSNDSTESNNELMLEDKKLEFGRGLVVPIPQVPREDKITSPSESKKRCRLPCDIPRSKKSMKCSKCPKIDDSDDDNNNVNNNAVMVHRQTSSSCCSEDESNASHELNGTTSCSSSRGRRAPNPNGKTRASRGSATDPQSLYARKRRERINERLKILQTLVPNGTKVDISTMLEEAVEYVKFLQLQIKLLSSDDLWMYSPIAYNGMDIGLDLRISTARPQPS